ncbi:MAG: hypothetical protein UT63_C0008G0019 [Candidatus Gottesmanbacteria bacterium GW2011_GWC2_39_8]|uniref:Serine aminopeptidase S33 domain-containing protein n=1 Tax=Candidatus Gottesmanbacteria bacterium GW2011_GWC2_39_8 TaxID=1618450 RepID=A0A0G0SH31_9BACT|nr:MAG: hypothetical protein UT63_C0008G0019 [Candidatus Gottesmanbacteria bacterium GW2011_GWC2_39_8]
MKDRNINITTHKIYSTDNIELDSFLFEPKNGTDKIVIHIHGKEGHFVQNKFVLEMGYSYPKTGYSFLTFNNRGHDYIADLIKKTATGFTSVLGGSAYDIIEDCVHDINGVLNYVKDLGYKEIILQGHSLGPHKISYYLDTKPNPDISKVILISTSDILFHLNSEVPHWEEVSGLAKKMIYEGRGKEIMAIRLWSNCPVSAETFWNYTRPDSNTYCFNYTQPHIPFRHFENISLPIFTVVAETDFAMGIPQEKAMKMLKERSSSEDIETYIVKGTSHNFAGKIDELTGTITDWLKKHE